MGYNKEEGVKASKIKTDVGNGDLVFKGDYGWWKSIREYGSYDIDIAKVFVHYDGYVYPWTPENEEIKKVKKVFYVVDVVVAGLTLGVILLIIYFAVKLLFL